MLRLMALLPFLIWSCTDETISGWSDPETVWILQEIDGMPFPATATLSFPEEGAVRGQGPCNAYTARQVHPYPWIGIEAVAATRRACPALAAEAVFLAGLEAATLAEATESVLILTDGAGAEMVFRAAPDVTPPRGAGPP